MLTGQRGPTSDSPPYAPAGTDGHILDPVSRVAELPDLMMCVPARTTTLAR